MNTPPDAKHLLPQLGGRIGWSVFSVVCVCMYIYIYILAFKKHTSCVCAHIRAMYIHVRTYIYTHYICIYIYMCTYVYIHIYIYIYIHIDIHVHICQKRLLWSIARCTLGESSRSICSSTRRHHSPQSFTQTAASTLPSPRKRLCPASSASLRKTIGFAQS